MTIHVSEKPHAVLGPSGWHTWGFCAGAPVLSESLPHNSSGYAREGTAAHAVLEECIADRKDAEFLIGEEVEVEGEIFTVDNEMAEAVNSSIDIVYSYKKPGDVLQVEQTVPLAFMTGEDNAEGTCDVSLLTENGTHLHVFDFKYGKGVQVYASDPALLDAPPMPNGQLAMYALGWLQKHGFVYEDVTKVTLHVLQPRLEWHDEYELTLEQLRNFESVIRAAAGDVEMARQAHLEGNDVPLNPTEKGCKFCKAKAHCPALKNAVTTALATVAPSSVSDFEDLSLPKQVAAVAVNEGVSSEKLAEFLRAVPLMESAIEAVRAEVERRLFAGEQVPGFYLGVGRQGNRSWISEKVGLEELTRSGRLKMAEALQKKPISPTAAEKLLKARPKVWDKLQPFITRTPGKPSVCKEGDKNPPYEIASPASAFANLDAPDGPTITTVKAAATGNGTYVEANDGQHLILPQSAPAAILKLAVVGQSYNALALAASVEAEPSLEDLMG